MTVVRAEGVRKYFTGGDGGRIDVLSGVDLVVERSEMVAIVGSSGAGKSTLLNLLGALDKPSAGTIHIAGTEIGGLNDDKLAQLRASSIGFVFQFHHLLKEFSALENVMMPLRIAGVEPQEAEARARDLLGRVNLGSRLTHRPAQLSGGEQQRTAVARALAARPALLLADEPSGNLDHSHSEQLHDLLSQLAGEFGLALVVVTHNSSLASRASRVLLLKDGMLRESNVREMVGA